LEKGFYAVKKLDLLFDAVATSFTDVHNEKDCCVEVGQGGNSLHFDRVPLVKWMVQNSGSVDDLPLRILVLAVADK